MPSALLLTLESGSSSFEAHFPAFVSILSTDLATFSYTKLGDLPGRHSSWFWPFFSSFETIDRLETWFDYLRKPSQLKTLFFQTKPILSKDSDPPNNIAIENSLAERFSWPIETLSAATLTSDQICANSSIHRMPLSIKLSLLYRNYPLQLHLQQLLNLSFRKSNLDVTGLSPLRFFHL